MEPRNCTSPAARACAALERESFGNITKPDDPEYQTEQQVPWSEANWLPAACYVRPQNTAQVASLLSTVKNFASKFAIRSTGHNPTGGWSSVGESGVLMDLRDLNSVSLDEGGTLRAGGGAKWGKIYTFLEENGRSAIGARNLDVSVGGYTLGGGMPAFPNIHGLAADNVKNFKVVLANSSIVNANCETNPNLWRALKGGGTNFGIITRIDFQTFPLISTKYAVHVYDTSDYVNNLQATVAVQESMESDPKIGLFVSFNPTFVSVGLLYADAPSEIPGAFKPFLDLQSLINEPIPWTTGTIKSLVESIQYTAPSARRTQAVTAARPSLDLYIRVHELWIVRNQTATAEIFYTIQPIASGAVTVGEEKEGNIMGIEKVAQQWHAFAGFWAEASQDEQGSEDVDGLRRAADDLARSSGDFLQYQFMNDASPTQTVLQSYGSANLQKIRDVATAYDPERVFQELQNDGPLLRRIE